MSNANGNNNDIYVTSVAEFLNEITNISDMRIWYRGLSDDNYTLKPTLFRLKQFETDTNIIEYSIINDFEKLYGLYHNDKFRNYLDMLSLAQHYGAPTRLLDFSTSPLVALFFACENKKSEENGKDGSVCYVDTRDLIRNEDLNAKWCVENQRLIHEIMSDARREKSGVDTYFLDPEDLNNGISNLRDDIVLYVPTHHAKRQEIQKSVFILMNNDVDIEDYVKRIKIKREHKIIILNELKVLGYDTCTIYQTLDALGESISDFYNRNPNKLKNF